MMKCVFAWEVLCRPANGSDSYRICSVASLATFNALTDEFHHAASRCHDVVLNMPSRRSFRATFGPILRGLAWADVCQALESCCSGETASISQRHAIDHMPEMFIIKAKAYRSWAAHEAMTSLLLHLAGQCWRGTVALRN